MEKSFWDARWTKHEIGFHAAAPNLHLIDAFGALFPSAKPRHALVPLCGKSLDLHWLRERCERVTGVEFVPEAVAEFFTDWGVTPEVVTAGSTSRYHHENIEIIRGDFFAIAPSLTDDVDFYYDRAALIALPPEMRARYAEQVARLLPVGAQGVVVTIDYDQSERSGPPFAVTDDHLEALYGRSFELARRDRRQVSDPPRGLAGAAFTSTWLCQRR